MPNAKPNKKSKKGNVSPIPMNIYDKDMMHERELIYDAKKAIHRIDQQKHHHGHGPHMESKKQQKHNLLYDNPIDNRGTFMSKHSGSAPFKHQGYNSRLDDSLGSKHGSKNQSMKSRRDESEAMEHHFGHNKFSSNKHSH